MQQYVWYTKFMFNQEGDDPVPTMDDFNRERRFFKITEVRDFVVKSLDNYYEMFINKNNEFEDYTKSYDATLFPINITTEG